MCQRNAILLSMKWKAHTRLNGALWMDPRILDLYYRPINRQWSNLQRVLTPFSTQCWLAVRSRCLHTAVADHFSSCLHSHVGFLHICCIGKKQQALCGPQSSQLFIITFKYRYMKCTVSCGLQADKHNTHTQGQEPLSLALNERTAWMMGVNLAVATTVTTSDTNILYDISAPRCL